MKTKQNKIIRIICSILLSLLIATPASALSDAILDKLDNSNIYYYDPAGTDCAGTTSPLADLKTDGANLAILGDNILQTAVPALQTTFSQLPTNHIVTMEHYTATAFADSMDVDDAFSQALENSEIVILSLTSTEPNDILTTITLNKIIGHIGAQKNIFLVTAHNDPLLRSDLDFTAHNRLLRQTALNNGHVFLIDWAAAIQDQEDIYLADGLLPNADGQSLLASTINDTIRRNRATTADFTDMETDTDSISSTLSANLPTSTLTYLKNAKVKEKATANLELYATVAAEKNLPWQLLAAIHFREANLDPNKSLLNGQSRQSSAYTNVDGQTIAPGAYDDARNAADHLISAGKSVYGINLSTNSSTAEIGKATLAYNRGYMYKNASPEATYDQSPYVMNGYNEQHLQMRWLHADSYSGATKLNSLEGKEDARPGILAVMAYLGANVNDNSIADCAVAYTASLLAGGGILDEGGMTLEQARVFMMRYGENRNNDSRNAVGAYHWNFCNGGGSNCATFSHFFVSKFSTSTWGGGNGYAIVNNLARYGTRTGNEPAVYAVLSTDPNHTAVVLGHYGDEWYIGHASCSSPNIGKGNGTKEGGGSGWVYVEHSSNPLEWHWMGSWVKFAYLDGIDTNKLQEYINNGP